MADNFEADPGTGGKVFVTAQGSWSGDTADLPGQFGIIASGSEGSWTFTVQPGGAGNVTAGTPRVTLADNDPAVTKLGTIDADTSALAGTVAGTELQVDVVAALPAGTNLLGKVGIDQTTPGTTNAVVASIAAAQTLATVTTVGTVTTITNVVHVDDNAGSLTVDNNGTFAVQAACVLGAETTKVIGTVNIAAAQTIAVTNAGTFAVQAVCTNAGTFAVQAACTLAAETTKVIGTVNIAAAQTLATVTNLAQLGGAAVSMGTGARDAGTQRVTIATNDVVPASQSGTWNVGTVTTVSAVTAITNALPAGTNAIGKLAANSGVDIGDVDVTSIAAGTNTIGGVIAQTSTSGAYDGTTACTIKRASGIATASGANTIIAAVADKKIRVLALSLISTSTTAVVLYVYNGDYMLLGDGTNKITLDMDGVGGPAGLVLPFNVGGWFQTDTNNEALAVNLGAATPVIWAITYIEVA